MDVEKTIEFILTTQARTEAVLGQLADDIAELTATSKRHEAEILATAGAVHALLDRDEARSLQAKETDQRMREMDERLTAKIDQTTDNLNALIKVVDGLVRRGSNGHHAE